ncbi:hypothetical protein A5906_12885 [Bradyrhizobium sacchari]|nr:hypothetical protein A5906_12885 [Bradyrhizobium sacchari]
MLVIDVARREEISTFPTTRQPSRLVINGLAEAAGAFSRGLGNKIDFLAIGKFANQRAAAGRGLRAEFVT